MIAFNPGVMHPTNSLCRIAFIEDLTLTSFPHITIANSPDRKICQEIAKDWNLKDFKIEGSVSQLDIIEHEKIINEVTMLAKEAIYEYYTKKNVNNANASTAIKTTEKYNA